MLLIKIKSLLIYILTNNTIKNPVSPEKAKIAIPQPRNIGKMINYKEETTGYPKKTTS